MQTLITIPTENVYGITHARELHNASVLEANAIASDEAYLQHILARAVESWCNAANVVPPPAPVDPVVIDGVPQVVSRKQGRAALILAGLFDLVQPIIDAIADPTQRALTQNAWDSAQQFERHDPFLLALAAGMGLDDAAMNALFVQAATL